MPPQRICVSLLRNSPGRRLSYAIALIVMWAACCFVTNSTEAQPLLAPPGLGTGLPGPAETGLPPPMIGVPRPIVLSPSTELLPIPADGTSPGAKDALPNGKVEGVDVLEELPGNPPRAVWLRSMPWETSIEFGLNGSSGTSDSLSIRAGGHVLRESRFSKLDLHATYNHTTSGGDNTQDNADLDVRNDWLLDEASPWTLFGTGELFYDQFQAFDLQTSANTGIGYRFVHGPMLDMIGRLGVGTSREIGGPDDRWVPESLVGFEYSQRFSAQQKVTAKIDYYPEWDQVGEYRVVADVGWEIALDRPSNVCLKLSANDRYDSTPGGADPHLVNYSVLLLIKL